MIINVLLIFSLLLNNPTPTLDYASRPRERVNKVVNKQINNVNCPLPWAGRVVEGWGGVHAYHTSLTEINYNQKEKTLEISIRVFTDDLASAITKLNNNQKVIIAANDKNDALIEKYMQQHFGIFSPQKQRKKLNFIGKEIEGEATWIYLELPNCELVNETFPAGNFLLNNILTELFNDQTNLVNFKVLSSRKTFIFNNKKVSSEITF